MGTEPSRSLARLPAEDVEPIDAAMLGPLTLIVAMLVAGLVAQKLDSFPESAAETLNKFVVQICVPAAVLLRVPALTLDVSLAWLVITPWLLTGLTIPLVLGARRVLGFGDAATAVLLLCLPLGNTSFVGYPMIGALLGEDRVQLAVVYDQLGSFVLVSTYGLFVVARYAGTQEPSMKDVALRVLKFPPFVALLVALIPIPHPAWFDAALDGISKSLVPVAMFAVALKMKLRLPPEKSALFFALFGKMVLLPVIALALGLLVHAPRDVLNVMVLESAMPPMVTAGALAVAAGFAPELVAATVGFGIALSVATLPIWTWILERLGH